jgi:hypothetical protein
MAEFPASELKKTFRCYGHFYRLNIAGIEPQLCRSVLEITSLPSEAVGAKSDPDDLFSNQIPLALKLPVEPNATHPALAGTPPKEGSFKVPLQGRGGRNEVTDGVGCASCKPLSVEEKLNPPDAVVIMMNPGSSRPIEDGDTDSLLTMPLPAGFQKPLVLTQPDNTQYQIMRIMVSKHWKHVRVLNISDLRDPKSPSFIAKTKALAGLPGGAKHSLFCEARAAERGQMLRRKPGAPFILGWGQDAGLIPLAKQCLSCITGEKTITVPAGNDPALTAHPSPMLQSKKEEWLDTILAAF